MNETTKRVLPADVYDTIELVAEAYGGIGAGEDYSPEGPCCVWGLAHDAEEKKLHLDNPVEKALRAADIMRWDNDCAVRTVNARNGNPRDARISFAEWCEALNVVRGE